MPLRLAADRVIFSQDGNQRAHGKWTYYEYDGLGRLKEQGECTKSGSTATSKEVWLENHYDDYSFIGEPGFTDGVYLVYQDHGKGLLTGRKLYVNDEQSICELICYDEKGRENWVMRNNLLGSYDLYITSYTYSGQPDIVTYLHFVSGQDANALIVGTDYTYDSSDRLTKVTHAINGNTQTLAEYTYDNLDRLLTRTLHGNSDTQSTYSYNVRDWLTGITGTKFNQNLYYNTGSGTACYNGNISSMTWKSGNETTQRGYKFAYDGLNRLTSATYGEGTSISSNANRFTEKVTSYDKNGNIKGLQRYGQTSASAYGLIDNLTYTLDGNRPTRVDDAVSTAAYNNGFEFKDAVKQANEYAYDANGNLTKDLNRNISNIEYNYLNLPSKVTFTDGNTIEYVYAADGTKLRTVHNIGGTTTTTDYCGNVVYENGTQKYLLTDEGYVALNESNKYYYYLKDHQGNNRVVVASDGTVKETNHYYPFGGLFAGSSSVQPYKYNGKEFDTKNGLNWYAYGARMYDPVLGRFTTQDRFAEKYPAMSLYQYGANNPVCNIDVNGDSIIVNPNPNGIVDHIMSFLGFDTKYQTQVKADLRQLKMDDKELKDMITHLKESENIHTITMPDKRTEYMNGTLYNKGIARENKSQKSTILYDPFKKKVNKGNIRTPRVGLAHELHHSYNLDMGTFDPDIKVNGILLMDIEAVNLENKIRKITGDNKRINYGNKKIPLELLE